MKGLQINQHLMNTWGYSNWAIYLATAIKKGFFSVTSWIIWKVLDLKMLTSTGGPSTCLVLSVSYNLGETCFFPWKLHNFILHNFHSHNFLYFHSVYARMEDLNEDSLYFFLKSGLISRVKFNQKLNSAHSARNTEQRYNAALLTKLQPWPQLTFFTRFWSQVNSDLISKLSESWAYKADFEMFDYSVKQYLEENDINVN